MASTWKDTNIHNRILRDAEAKGYGVIAGVDRRGHLVGRSQQQTADPVGEAVRRTAAEAVKRAIEVGVPISIHLDHAQSEDIIKRATELPFDSIMVDMSHYEKEVNLSKTKALVEYCNARQIATEAEPGRIEGGEDGVMDTAGEVSLNLKIPKFTWIITLKYAN